MPLNLNKIQMLEHYSKRREITKMEAEKVVVGGRQTVKRIGTVKKMESQKASEGENGKAKIPVPIKPSEKKNGKVITEKAKTTKKADDGKIELSRYGHRIGSMAALLDDLLWKGTSLKEAIAKLVKDFGRTEEQAIGKFRGHINYLPKKKKITVKADKERDFFKTGQEKI